MDLNLFSEENIKRAKKEKSFRNFLNDKTENYIVFANALYDAKIPMDYVEHNSCLLFEKIIG